jgi:hypothetical protein
VQPAAAQNGAVVDYNNEDPCCDCTCCEENCGGPLACIFKAPLKLFLFVFFLLLMVFIFCFRDLLVIIGMTIVCIFAGMFGFSFELLSDLEGATCVLGVIFFPVVMIIGIGYAFKEIFCDVVPDLCEEYCTLFCDGSKSIFDI